MHHMIVKLDPWFFAWICTLVLHVTCNLLMLKICDQSGTWLENQYHCPVKRYKYAKIRNKRNQKKIPTPKTEAEKTKSTIRYLHVYHENIA